MSRMPITFEVSKPDRSRDSREEQPENMEDMPVALDVSSPDRSRDSSDRQSRNMLRAVETAIRPSIFAEVIELR